MSGIPREANDASRTIAAALFDDMCFKTRLRSLARRSGAQEITLTKINPREARLLATMNGEQHTFILSVHTEVRT